MNATSLMTSIVALLALHLQTQLRSKPTRLAELTGFGLTWFLPEEAMRT
jgi:hypothetical protein